MQRAIRIPDINASPGSTPDRWMGKITRWLANLANWQTSAQGGVVRGNHQLGQGMVERASFPFGGKVLCKKGAVWITVDTGGEDIVLSRGESRGFKEGESIVIEAMGEAEIFVES